MSASCKFRPVGGCGGSVDFPASTSLSISSNLKVRPGVAGGGGLSAVTMVVMNVIIISELKGDTKVE